MKKKQKKRVTSHFKFDNTLFIDFYKDCYCYRKTLLVYMEYLGII